MKKSPKSLPKKLLKVIQNDSRSTTGSNLRNILLITDKFRVEGLKFKDIDDLTYAPVKEEDEWKIGLVKEMIDEKSGQSQVELMSQDELEEILEYLCIT